MPSPFPGMDPYLEGYEWPGVHSSLIVDIKSALNGALPDGYVARIDENVWVQDTDDDSRQRVKPDAFLPEPTEGTARRPWATATLTRPTDRVTLPTARKRKHRVVKIVTGKGRRVVTVLELLSPSNKNPGPDRDAYLHKRREYLSSANLVEIDLLRAGDRMPLGAPTPAVSDYYAFVCGAKEYPGARVWAFSVRDPLPVLPIPLEGDLDPVPLDLGACLARVYESSRYAGELDYTAPPTPALRKSDAEWARELLAARKGKK